MKCSEGVSSAMFSVRDWRSPAESLLSSDVAANFPPEQLS